MDFIRHCVQDSKNWMAAHDINFAKRYIDHGVQIAVRGHFGATHSVYDFVLSRVEPGRDNGERTGGRIRATKDNGVQPAGDTDAHSVLINVCCQVDSPENWVASTVRYERAKDRHDISGDILAPPLDLPFKLGGVVSEREVGILWGSNSRRPSGSISRMLQSGTEIVQNVRSQITEDVRNIPSKLDLELFSAAITIYLNNAGPWLIVDETVPLRFQIGNVFLCAC